MTVVKYYTLLDCNCDTPYLNALGEQVWFKAMGPISPAVSAVGGLGYFTNHTITEIRNDAGALVAEGCLTLVEVPFDNTITYTLINTGLYTFFAVDSCVQCKLSTCADVDEECTERTNCKFGDQVYALMLDNRYGLETCCEEDLHKWSIKKELNDLELMKQGYLTCPGDTLSCTPVCLPTKQSCGNC